MQKTILTQWRQVFFCLVAFTFSFTLYAADNEGGDYFKKLQRVIGSAPPCPETQLQQFGQLLQGETDSSFTPFDLIPFPKPSYVVRNGFRVGKVSPGQSAEEACSEQEKNFLPFPKPLRICHRLPCDLWLINVRGVMQNPLTSTYDQEYEGGCLTYFAPFKNALFYKTLGDYCKRYAMLRIWSNYSHFSLVRLPEGAWVDGIAGIAAPQITKEEDVQRNAESLEVAPDLLRETVPGGGIQLFVYSASHSDVFDMGSLFEKERFISKLGETEEKLYFNPVKRFPLEASRMNLSGHLLQPGWGRVLFGSQILSRLLRK